MKEKKKPRLFVMHGVGSSLLRYSFDDEREIVTATCPRCESYDTPYDSEPGREWPTLWHEPDCPVLMLIENFNNRGETPNAN